MTVIVHDFCSLFLTISSLYQTFSPLAYIGQSP